MQLYTLKTHFQDSEWARAAMNLGESCQSYKIHVSLRMYTLSNNCSDMPQIFTKTKPKDTIMTF